MTKIYILICPLDGQVKYVGKSNNPETRLNDHCYDARCMDLGKAQWIRLLRSKKLKPELVVVDEVSLLDWKFWEEWWSHYFKSQGFILFNKRTKNGLTYSNAKTFQPGYTPWNKGRKIKYRYDH